MGHVQYYQLVFLLGWNVVCHVAAQLFYLLYAVRSEYWVITVYLYFLYLLLLADRD